MTNEEFLASITLEGEEWRPVKNAEEWYAVSSFGRICSLERTIIKKDGKPHNFHPKILSGYYHKDGYRMVYINYGSGKRKNMNVHRLVATAFIPNPNNLPQVDHIDRNPKNNHVSNLRWVTQLENLHNRKLRGIPKSNSRDYVVARIKDSLIDKIYPFLFCVEEDGFSRQSVSHCCLGRRKSHKGYQWKYIPKNLVNQ